MAETLVMTTFSVFCVDNYDGICFQLGMNVKLIYRIHLFITFTLPIIYAEVSQCSLFMYSVISLQDIFVSDLQGLHGHHGGLCMVLYVKVYAVLLYVRKVALFCHYSH